ncbi:MAG: choice-of-anchor I family protein [Steroidobacteraceae bacterium]|jgi:hypothetical protein|nr:choice-of-anchor I family protein [Steroidobacteraceae bacterium]
MKGIWTWSTAMIAAVASVPSWAEPPAISFTDLAWRYTHTSTATQVPAQTSEIPAYDEQTRTLWVAGVGGIDVLDAATGTFVEHIDTRALGGTNSVAISNGLAAIAVESTTRTAPGQVLFYDTRTRRPVDANAAVTVGSLPDMVTFTPDGKTLLVANEGTPSVYGPRLPGGPPVRFGPAIGDPPGSVSIIDVETRTLVKTVPLDGTPIVGANVRRDTGMDFEPESIAVDRTGRRAYVTLQEANAMAILDLRTRAFTQIVGLGSKDFAAPGNQLDPLDNGTVQFVSAPVRGLYMPDTIASYSWRGRTLLVMANEGDFREDDGDRAAAGNAPLSAATPLNRLRVSTTDSTPGNLFTAGGRSFSIRDENGTLIYDSGDLLDKEANARGIYNDARSRDKGVEPEGVALLEANGRTFALIGLERTRKTSAVAPDVVQRGAVAVFDITNPFAVRFLDMIVTVGDEEPEGLAVFKLRGEWFLAICNELTRTTTVYRLLARGKDREDGIR